MAACLVCTDGLTLTDILNLVKICDVDGKAIAFKTKQVAFNTDCSECGGSYMTVEDMIRNSLWCDDNGEFYIQIVIMV